MNEFKGTPGPWFNNETAIHACEGRSYVAEEMSIHRAVDVQIANAQLIAAAPELLEALNMALEWIDAVPSDVVLPTMPGFDRDYVNNVILKALGETK